MTRIDSARLTEIFRALAASRSQSTSRKTSSKADDTSVKETLDNTNSRDKSKLREQLSLRLLKLKRESAFFENEAPLVAINEVLLWEFGDRILDHPDFKYVAKTVCDTIDTDPLLRDNMRALISDLVGQQ